MGLLMKKGSVMKCSALGLSIGLAGASLSLAGGVDPALQSAFMEIFPTASVAKNIAPESRSSRAPQVLELRNGETLLGYGVSLKVVSRSGAFRILVAISPEETVKGVKVPKYPHRRGRAVKRQTFLDQFNGVAYGAPLKLGEQVDGVSGATSSATALTGGVRQALILVHRYRKSGN
jgi:Na+-translocating ferredoxin:NAD+ oxidoreductase RnfG subunit